MEFTDWVTIALIIGGIVLESRRGSLTAWIDVAGVIVAYRAATFLYPQMLTDVLSPQNSFLLVFGMIMVAVLFTSMYIRSTTQKFMTSIDYVLGGLGGAVTALVLSAVLFQYILVAFGSTDPWFAKSVFRPVVYNVTWYQHLVHHFAR